MMRVLMSRRITEAVEIAAPVALVWQVFSRLEDWPLWFPALTALERAGTGPIVVGEAFTLALQFRGRGTRVKVRVSESAPARVRWSGRSFAVTGDHAFFAEAIDDHRSRFCSDEIFSGLPVALIPRAIFKELSAECRAGLARFRTLVEAATLAP
jgi:hypothetical protein